MNILNLLERDGEIFTSISKCKRYFGSNALYGGNCGMFSLALCYVYKTLRPTLGIMFRDNGDINSISDLLNAETDIYHVVVKIGDVMYDGDGQITSEDLLKLAYTEYKDKSPGFFSDVDPFERDVISLIRNDTNWTISFEKFVNLMK